MAKSGGFQGKVDRLVAGLSFQGSASYILSRKLRI